MFLIHNFFLSLGELCRERWHQSIKAVDRVGDKWVNHFKVGPFKVVGKALYMAVSLNK